MIHRITLPPTRLILPDPLKPDSPQLSQLITRLVPWDLAISPDGKKIATSFLEPGSPLEVWETNGLPIWTSGSYQGFLTFTHDGRFLICGTRFGGLIVGYNADTGQELFAFPSGTKILMGLKAMPDGKGLIAAGFDGQILKIDIEQKKTVAVLRPASPKPAPDDFPLRVYTMDLSPDGKRLAIGLQVPRAQRKGKGACCVAILDTQTGAIQNRFVEEADDIHSVAFSPVDPILAVHFHTVREDGVPDSWIVRLLDLNTGKFLRDLSREPSGDLVFSKDGRMLYGLKGSQFAAWDTHNGMVRRRLMDPEGFGKTIAIADDGESVATLTLDKSSALLWRGKTGSGKKVRWLMDDLERIMQDMGRGLGQADLDYVIKSRSLERQDLATYDLARSPTQARQEIEKALRAKDGISNEFFAALCIEVLESLGEKDLLSEATKHVYPPVATEAKAALERMKRGQLAKHPTKSP